MSNSRVRTSRSSGGRVDVVITRSVRANALDTETAIQLRQALESIGRSGARVVVLRGEGRNFCGGADLEEMSALGPIEAERFIRRLHLAFQALRSLPQPVIAQVHGAALGAGLEMMISCDLVVCDSAATLGMPEPHVGLPSVIEAALLPSMVGLGRAREMLLVGDNFSAQRGLEMGLVNSIAAADQLDECVADLVSRLSRHHPQALRLQKELLRRWQELPMSEAIEAGIGAFAMAMAAPAPGDAMRGVLAKPVREDHSDTSSDDERKS